MRGRGQSAETYWDGNDLRDSKTHEKVGHRDGHRYFSVDRHGNHKYVGNK